MGKNEGGNSDKTDLGIMELLFLSEIAKSLKFLFIKPVKL